MLVTASCGGEDDDIANIRRLAEALKTEVDERIEAVRGKQQ